MEIDIVEWEEAIEEGGAYFKRAHYLGLPKPQRSVVNYIISGDIADCPIDVIGDYHMQLILAELKIPKELQVAYNEFLDSLKQSP
jgi:hypothetical protein